MLVRLELSHRCRGWGTEDQRRGRASEPYGRIPCAAADAAARHALVGLLRPIGDMTGNTSLSAVVFDLDGVVTFTARQHQAAWAELFDEFLRRPVAVIGLPPAPFTEDDYRELVDGRPRLDGIRTFLRSRGILLPEGAPGDPSDAPTVHGLGRRKNELFHARIAREGVEVDPEAVRLLRELRAAGVRVGMASSSRNAGPILEAAGLAGLFDAAVDGVAAADLGLAGKPAPDIFLEALRQMGVPDPAAAAVVEDAASGVAAGRAGGFGLVIGIDRIGDPALLRDAGADRIITSFAGVGVETLRGWLAAAGSRASATQHEPIER